jgi:hypothetical protein
MSSIFGSPTPRRPFMHLEIADAGRDDQLAHTPSPDWEPHSIHQPVTSDDRWHKTVIRVLSRRRNAIARALQRWACESEVRLRAFWGAPSAGYPA